jgi:hypothetical protein
MFATVDRIVAPPGPWQPEQAQMAVDGADRRHRDLRIENALTDEPGDDARLTKGDPVDVTVTTEPRRSRNGREPRGS